MLFIYYVIYLTYLIYLIYFIVLMDPPSYEEVAGDFTIINPIESGVTNESVIGPIISTDPPPYIENNAQSNLTITSANSPRVQFQVNADLSQSVNITTTRKTPATPIIRVEHRAQTSNDNRTHYPNEEKLFPDPDWTLGIIL